IHYTLFQQLQQYIPTTTVNIIKNIYANTNHSVISTTGRPTEPTTPRKGVRQGCPCSPILFIFYLDKIFEDTLQSLATSHQPNTTTNPTPKSHFIATHQIFTSNFHFNFYSNFSLYIYYTYILLPCS